MARSRAITFGPGSLESVELRLWAKNRTYGAVICAEIRGWFTVYCGAGNSHTVDVSGARECADRRETPSQLARVTGHEDIGSLILRAYDDRDDDIAHDVASWLVNEYALEDWCDPCTEAPVVWCDIPPNPPELVSLEETDDGRLVCPECGAVCDGSVEDMPDHRWAE